MWLNIGNWYSVFFMQPWVALLFIFFYFIPNDLEILFNRDTLINAS